MGKQGMTRRASPRYLRPRRQWAAAAVLAVAAALLVPTPAHAAVEPLCVTHPAGTAIPSSPSAQGHRRADIVEICADYSLAGGVHLSLRVAEPTDPLADRNWARTPRFAGEDSFVRWVLDTDMDGTPDEDVTFNVTDGRAHVAVQDARSGQLILWWDGQEAGVGPEKCWGVGTFDGAYVHATVAADCIGSPAEFQAGAMVQYEDLAADKTYVDRVSPQDEGLGPVALRASLPGDSFEPPASELRMVNTFTRRIRHSYSRRSIVTGEVFRFVPGLDPSTLMKVRAKTTVTVARRSGDHVAYATVTRAARARGWGIDYDELRRRITARATQKAMAEALPVARRRAAARLAAQLD